MADRTILKRMTNASGAVAVDPALRAMATAIPRASEAILGLPLSLSGVKVSPVTLADLPERIEERSLFALIEAPGDRQGVAILSPGLVAAIIEMLTYGQMSPAEPPPRRPTRTDAALSVGLIERILAETDMAAAGELPWPVWEGGYRYASNIDDPRLLPLVIDDIRYQLIQCSLTLGLSGGREATLALLLPEWRAPAVAGPARQNAAWQEQLAGAVLAAEAEISAVLARVSCPLSEVIALQPGAVLRLPDDALTNLRLEGAGHRLLARAKLGQYRGYLAVRLTAASGTDAGGVGFTPARISAAEERATDADPPVQRPAGA